MRDLREFHDPHLHLPINGKTYTVKAPTADLGLRIKRHTASGSADQGAEIRFIAELLGAEYDPDTDEMSGGLWDEMNADGVPYNEIVHVGNTALAHYGVSPEFGELWWETRLGKEHLPLVPEASEEWERQRVAQKVAELYPNAPEKPTKKTTS